RIKKTYPSCFLSLVVREENLKAVEAIKEIDLIIPDRKKTDIILSSFELIKKIRQINFDIAIIPHRSLRTAVICWLGRIDERIGFDVMPSSIFYTKKIPFKWTIHNVERNMMLVDCITDTSNISFPKIRAESKALEGITRPIIVINPFSIWKTKRWPIYKFAALIMKLRENYKTMPLIIGSSDEKEQSKELEKLLPENSVINLCGKTDLSNLIDIIKRADILITNDSGPMHIAVATQTPVIAIFGPTTKELGFFPYSDKSDVIEVRLRCRPCSLHGSKRCPNGHFLCMKLISVDSVLKATEKFLKYTL
ncbi:MAG: glycosyltransferase family 9 protein, partial [Elusimicrobiales bacterium]